MSIKYVYTFGGDKAEGRAEMKNLLGGKGANLAEMSNLGVPVPAGFTISTEVCTAYYDNNEQYPEGLVEQVQAAITTVEETMGATFGDPDNPLLLSVRSGARVSMPGMMDTVLNIGLNDVTVQGLIKATDNPRMAYDSYRRFVQMFGNVVLGVPGEHFEHAIDQLKEQRGVKLDTDLTVEDLQGLVASFKGLVANHTGQPFPDEPKEQLWAGISAVFSSWQTPRAITYRDLNGIPGGWGTAVNVQAMVFGNMGDDSATGVAFTRDPATGANLFFGEFLFNAQGEDVVAGTRTPQPINLAQKKPGDGVSLEEAMPTVYAELKAIYERLELHYRDMQDIEFTIQRGKLWMLQTRTGKRTAAAAVQIAVDMKAEGLITQEEAVLRVDPASLDQLLHPQLDPKAAKTLLTKALPASPGAATGRVVFSSEEAAERGAAGDDVILVRLETSPEDIHGMAGARGILTARGGMTSHAAVVARGMGKCCVSGAEAAKVSEKNGTLTVGDVVVKHNDWLTLDGSTGEVFLGHVPTIPAQLTGTFGTLMGWADSVRNMGVRTNADTPEDAVRAREFGAEGIGLCRTEHMFFADDRLPVVQQMILAKDAAAREPLLAKLEAMQQDDFYGILKAMDGLPVIIRLLDPPLHEFLPKHEELLVELALLKERKADAATLQAKETFLEQVEKLHEFNPMLGHRGCRLGVTFPDVYRMQVKALFQAACQLKQEGLDPHAEVMIPLVGHVRELEICAADVHDVAKTVMAAAGVEVPYMVGTMIELPRAALTADQIAKHAEFFSFGTNDLTQTTFGFSRDDAEGKFFADYKKQGILPVSPFQVLDRDGVGQLVAMGVTRGRATRHDLEVGICGEHGGEPSSVAFCHDSGLNYVSCSPFRVPIARLAAAHAAIHNPR